MRLILCILSAWAAPAAWATAEICHLGDWTKAYGAASPIAAYSKTSPFLFIPRLLQQAAKPQVDLRPQDLAAYGLSKDGVRNIHRAINVSWARVGAPDARDHAIRQNMISFFGQPQAGEAVTDTLSVAFVGLFHAVDLFIVAPEVRATYASIPFTMETKLLEPNFRAIVSRLGTDQAQRPMTVGDDAFNYMLMPYLFARQVVLDTKRDIVPAAPARTKGRSLVLSDLHGMDSSEWVARLPGADCLRAAGVQRLRIALEGYRTDQLVTPAQIIYRRTWLEQADYRAGKLKMPTEVVLKRVFPEDLVARIMRGEATDNPSALALARKLAEYAKAGLTVEIRGLEDPSFQDMGD